MSIVSIHHAVMKVTAVEDYDKVMAYCVVYDLPVFEPKGKSWQRVEDATAEMLKNIEAFPKPLNRGASYYKSLLTPTASK